MPPLVSVLIPCFNAEKYVGEAIESALTQTHPHVEVVVVDDGSTDNSGEVIRSFGDRVIAELGPNRGACAARNRALALSRGEYVQFLDADDLLLPNKIERQLPPLVRGEADLVFCKGNLFRDGQIPTPKKRPIELPGHTDPFVYCLRQGLATEGPLHRRSALERVGGFREHVRRAQELDLHVRLAAAGTRLGFVDDWLYSHRDHDGPRITRTPQPADALLNLLLELSVVCEASPYTLTAERRDCLAGVIFQHSIYAYRNGARAAAARGFEHARELSSSFSYAERGWYKVGTRVVGPLTMEWILATARCVFGRSGVRTG